MIEPGQPCVMSTGKAFSCFERTWMKWMSRPSISVMKLRHGVETRLDLAPVVVGGPVAREFLHRRERHALRRVRDGFLLRESCRRDTPAQFGEFRAPEYSPETDESPLPPPQSVSFVITVSFAAASYAPSTGCLVRERRPSFQRSARSSCTDR